MGIVRKTKSVMALLNAFEQSNHAQSAAELSKGLQQIMNKTTVYRILERLEDEGTLHSFIGKDGLKWYAKCNGCTASHHSDEHPHFQCRDCGKVECVGVNISIPQINTHKIDSMKLILIGQCESCQA